MSDQTPSPRDSEIVSESVAARLLTRASELDAARRTGVDVADLRTAALEAGISAASFEAALDELKRADALPVPVVRRTPRWGRWVGTVAAVALFAVFGIRMISPVRRMPVDTSPMIKGEFLLRCITPGQAAQLIRPMLDRPGNRVTTSEAQSPGVLSIEATQQQMQRVQAVLDQHEKSLTGVCVSGRTNG